MPAVHSASPTAQTSSRDRTVVRQSAGIASLLGFVDIAAVSLQDGDDGLVGRRRGSDPLDHDGLPARRGHEVQLLGRNLLDPARRAQSLDLEPEMAIDLLFRGTLLLHALDLVAMLQQLEVLPGRKQQHDDQEQADPERAPQLALSGLVDLPDDRVVANVLLDRVLEVHRAHANLSITRSLALRARGLRAVSASPGTAGRFVRIRRPSPAFSSARNVCFTIRSSSEWNVITANRAPASRRRAASPRNTSRPSSSRLTQIRSAWNVRVAGSIR